jgi:hypothetical protein
MGLVFGCRQPGPSIKLHFLHMSERNASAVDQDEARVHNKDVALREDLLVLSGGEVGF